MAKKPLVEDMIRRRVEIAKRLEMVRKNMKMTKTDFAHFIGITEQYYGTVSKGENFLATDKLISFAINSDISIDYLLLGKQTNNDELNYIFEHLTPSEAKEMIAIMKSIYNLSIKNKNC